jgi:hypothetical protein
LNNREEAAQYLFDNLRIDEGDFGQLDSGRLEELARALRSRKVATCARLLRHLRSGA